jgi:hypothetical protein
VEDAQGELYHIIAARRRVVARFKYDEPVVAGGHEMGGAGDGGFGAVGEGHGGFVVFGLVCSGDFLGREAGKTSKIKIQTSKKLQDPSSARELERDAV